MVMEYGARNAFLELGPKLGGGVFRRCGERDAAVAIAKRLISLTGCVAYGSAVVIGHNGRCISLQGGRGMATTIGVFLVLITQPMLIVGGPRWPYLSLRRI